MYKIDWSLAHYNPQIFPAARAKGALRARTATRRETRVSTQASGGKTSAPRLTISAQTRIQSYAAIKKTEIGSGGGVS